MSNRKTLSKKTRFEVFKRDKFTCQYCGRSAPDVILEVDHIEPVKEGGTNDIMNLVTSCKECNRGKGARELSDDSVIKKTQAQMQELADKNEQLSMILNWRKELRGIEDRQVDEVFCIINDMSNGGDIGWFSRSRAKIRSMLKRHSFQTILDATESSAVKFFITDGREINCEPEVNELLRLIEMDARKREDPMSEHKKNVYYLRKILINRFNLEQCWDEKRQAFEILSDLLSRGIEFHVLKELCCNCEHYGDFLNKANDLNRELKNGTLQQNALDDDQHGES